MNSLASSILCLRSVYWVRQVLSNEKDARNYLPSASFAFILTFFQGNFPLTNAL